MFVYDRAQFAFCVYLCVFVFGWVSRTLCHDSHSLGTKRNEQTMLSRAQARETHNRVFGQIVLIDCFDFIWEFLDVLFIVAFYSFFFLRWFWLQIGSLWLCRKKKKKKNFATESPRLMIYRCKMWWAIKEEKKIVETLNELTYRCRKQCLGVGNIDCWSVNNVRFSLSIAHSLQI